MRWISLLCLTMAALLVDVAPVTAADPDLDATEQAWLDDSVASFQRAATASPRSLSNREVKTRLEYLKAVAPGTVAAYEQFLRIHSDHPFAPEARKTLVGLRLASQPVTVLINQVRLPRDGMDLASIREGLWLQVRTALTSMGFASTLLASIPGSGPGGLITLGGLLTMDYEEVPGEEFFEGPLSVFGMAEPVGRGTKITAHLRLDVPGVTTPLIEKTITAATTLITSGDLRQSAIENFSKDLDHTLRSRLPVSALRLVDGVVTGPARAVAAGRGDLLGYLYVASGAAGLKIVDARVPSAPKVMATVATPGDALDVAVAGTVAYIVLGHQGLQLVDIAAPGPPRLLGRVATPSKALSVSVSGRQAYVACGDRGLAVIDVADPARPRLTAMMDTPEWTFAAVVLNGLAYVADRRTLEIMDTRHQQPISQVLSLELTETVAISPGDRPSDQMIYTGNRGGGIQIIQAASPRTPQILAALRPPYLDVTALGAGRQTGDIVVVSDGEWGPRLIDLRRPGQTTVRLVPLRTTWSVAVTRNVLAVAKGNDGLELRYLSPHMLRTILKPGLMPGLRADRAGPRPAAPTR